MAPTAKIKQISQSWRGSGSNVPVNSKTAHHPPPFPRAIPGQSPGIWLALSSAQWGIWPEIRPSGAFDCQRSEAKGFRNSLIQHVSRVHGYWQKSWVRVWGPLPKIPDLFMTKICDFCYHTYDLTKRFDTLITTVAAGTIALNTTYEGL